MRNIQEYESPQKAAGAFQAILQKREKRKHSEKSADQIMVPDYRPKHGGIAQKEERENSSRSIGEEPISEQFARNQVYQN